MALSVSLVSHVVSSRHHPMEQEKNLSPFQQNSNFKLWRSFFVLFYSFSLSLLFCLVRVCVCICVGFKKEEEEDGMEWERNDEKRQHATQNENEEGKTIVLHGQTKKKEGNPIKHGHTL